MHNPQPCVCWLLQFFAMVDFCNPGVLGSPAEFRKHFEAPILAGREPGASPEVAGTDCYS
jgi:hypothetical protein